MEMREDVVGEITVLEIKGRIDSTTAPTLGDRLLSTFRMQGKGLVIDLRELEYISSAGFRIFLLAAKRAEESASHLVLCGLSTKVKQLFDLGGFLDIFRIAGSREDAITSAK